MHYRKKNGVSSSSSNSHFENLSWRLRWRMSEGQGCKQVVPQFQRSRQTHKFGRRLAAADPVEFTGQKLVLACA
jgi:hypothetical protein